MRGTCMYIKLFELKFSSFPGYCGHAGIYKIDLCDLEAGQDQRRYEREQHTKLADPSLFCAKVLT